LFSIKINSF